MFNYFFKNPNNFNKYLMNIWMRLKIVLYLFKRNFENSIKYEYND